jgi:hypothetical protein
MSTKHLSQDSRRHCQSDCPSDIMVKSISYAALRYVILILWLLLFSLLGRNTRRQKFVFFLVMPVSRIAQPV